MTFATRTYWCILICLLCSSIGWAQQAALPDTSAIEVRRFAEEHIEDLKSDRDYQYEISPERAVSFWDQLRFWLWELLLRLFLSREDSSMFSYTIYALTGIAIVYGILKIMQVDMGGFLYRRSSHVAIRTQLGEENIHEIDFENAIAEARQQKAYRKTVRLLYLRLLKQLSDRHLIDWKINKTNHEYEIELKDPQIRRIFEQATYYFENIYYGDFRIDEPIFEAAQQTFQRFDQQIAPQ